MTVLVTGSSGHLGEALMRTLSADGRAAVGFDLLPSPYTTHVGSVSDRVAVRRAMAGATAVIHAATLHKPHVATHARQAFIDVNVTGTLNLLEEAAAARVGAFVFTSTTSVFGDAMRPPPDAPAAWIDETVTPRPKNIYGVTKAAAEDLCQLFHRNQGLSAVVLRTSRFFPEADDDPDIRGAFPDMNAKANEFAFRRVDLEDVVSAHLLALDHAPRLGFARYVVSATTPFTREDSAELRWDARAVLARRVPDQRAEYAKRGWRMFPTIDRVYDNMLARAELGWRPKHDFRSLVGAVAEGEAFGSALARAVGSKGYHAETFEDGPYPVEQRRLECC